MNKFFIFLIPNFQTISNLTFVDIPSQNETIVM